MENNKKKLEEKYESLRKSYDNELTYVKARVFVGAFMVSGIIFVSCVAINILSTNSEYIENLFFTLFFMGISIFLGSVIFKITKDFKDEEFCSSFVRCIPLIKPEDFQKLIDEDEVDFKFKNERVFRTKQGHWFKMDLRKYSQTLEIYKYAEHKIPIKNRISVNNSIKDLNGDI